MDILVVLISIAMVLVIVMLGLFLWSIRSGQFDDLEGPAHRILMDDDSPKLKADAPPESGDGKSSRPGR